MTNAEIIKNEVQKHYTPAQIHAMFTEHFPDQQSGDAEIEAIFVSGLFHTFQEWKRQGMSVKSGGKKAFTCDLWKYTSKPSAAARKAAEEAGEELADDPHYYKAPAHLFFVDQVAPTVERPAPVKANTVAYNKYLAACRKAGNKTPLSLTEWAAQQQAPATKPAEDKPAATTEAAKNVVIAVEEFHELPQLAKVPEKVKKAAGKKQAAKKPAAPKKATKPAAKKAAAKPSTKPAPVAVAATPTPAPAAEPDFAALAASILF